MPGVLPERTLWQGAAAQVCVVGSLNIDHMVRVSRCPGPGETIAINSSQISMGGKGGNQAVACGRASFKSKSAQRAGSKISMIGAVGGDDPYTNNLIKTTLERSGVCTDLILQDEVNSTGTAHVIVEEAVAGENRILISPGANHSRQMHDLEAIISMVGEQDPHVVVLQGEIPRSTVLGILCHFNAQPHGPKIVFNPAPVYPEGLTVDALRHTAVVVMNETEAAQVADCFMEDPKPSEKERATAQDAIREVCQHLHENCWVELVIVTLGAKGVFYSTIKGKTGRVSGKAVEKVIDTTAAGDTFVGYFAMQLAEFLASGRELHSVDEKLEELLEVANQAASKTVQRAGASTSIPFAYELDLHG